MKRADPTDGVIYYEPKLTFIESMKRLWSHEFILKRGYRTDFLEDKTNGNKL